MGNKPSLMLQDEEIKQISDETGFSSSQIEKLYSRFAHLDRSNCSSLSKEDLMSIPELVINPLCDRLIQMFFSECDQGDERINFRQFIRVLAAFRASKTNNSFINNSNQNDNTNMIRTRPKGHDNLKIKLLFVFKIYDADNDGRISFGDLRSILKMMVGNYIEDVRLDKIAIRAFVEVDQDNDGFIEFSEFCKIFAGKDLHDKLSVKFF